MAFRTEHLDLISICTGGGGLDLGVELAIPDARSVVLVEREAFAAAQLVSAMQQGLLAPAPVWSDARTFDGRAWRGAVDGLIGGIPCQPHSLAGKRLEREDPRDLWSTARRIIVQSSAWFVLIENVGGFLSAGDDEIAGAERVWRDLQRLGFAVEIGLFTAAETGASIRRERVFVLGIANREGWEGPVGRRQPESAREEWQAPHREPMRPDRRLGPPGPDQVSLIPRDPDALAGRLLRHRVDALRLLGNGVVPLEAAYAVRTLATRLASRGSAGAARLVRMMAA